VSTDPFDRGLRPPREPSLFTNPVTWIVVVLVVGTAVGLYLWKEKADQQARLDQLPTQPAAPAPPAATAPQPEPVKPEAEAPPPPRASEKPLPPLAESDEAIHAAIRDTIAGNLSGNRPANDLVVTKDIARRIVATVDNLPRHKVAVRLLPVRSVGGQLITHTERDAITLSTANYARYAMYVKLADGLDAKEVVSLYARFYPLFQQAYRELGYPNKSFNARLIEVIDDLLAAPDIAQPIKLVQPKVLYEFEDPELEDRSAGQKVLIRIGPVNAAIVKAKLRDIRQELTAPTPPTER
jgi:hypothetical protein